MHPMVLSNYIAKIDRTVEALRRHNMDAHRVNDRDELLELIRALVPVGATAASGGSMTLEQTGVIELLKNGGYDYYYRGRKDPATGEEIDAARRAFSCDWYFVSSNAITEDGYLYNVDGIANRTAAMLFGPKNVVVVAGCNKIVRDLDEAVKRVQYIAAPANAVRLERGTPCLSFGRCADCQSEQRICCDFVVMGQQRVKDRIKVLILPEELGF